ncbi:MAG: beta-ketoacyl-[acyl-carrier-protein] synthase family protein [bacterium]
MKTQPVITGLGILSPIGIGIDGFWRSAIAGRSGIGPATLFDVSSLPPECRVVGEVPNFAHHDWVPPQIARTAGRFSQFAVAAAKMASADADIPSDSISPERIKISIGTSLHGQDVAETGFQSFLRGDEIRPWTSNESAAHAAASHVAISTATRAQTVTFATACAGGIDAIAWAANEIERVDATMVLAGATDAPLSPFVLRMLQAVGVLSRWQGSPNAASRPFDRLRSGLVLAEGAAIVVVEDELHARERGARIYAKILGSASATEGRHLRKVDENGHGVARSILGALDQAHLPPTDIDYLCAHGNSMQDYDIAETAGIKRVFGRHAWNLPISSIKSMCGQALAASSAMQVVTSCLVLRDQIIPPTINYEFFDPRCDLDYVPNTARVARVRHVLIHAHSLGGAHVAMVLRTAS